MGLAHERNKDLAFDTEVLRAAATKYKEIAEKLEKNCEALDGKISTLTTSGWTTDAGTAFYELVNTNWAENIKKYVELLKTLSATLTDAAKQYDDLLTEHVYKTKINIDQP